MILKRRRSSKSFRCDGKVDESVLGVLLSVFQSTLYKPPGGTCGFLQLICAPRIFESSGQRRSLFAVQYAD